MTAIANLIVIAIICVYNVKVMKADMSKDTDTKEFFKWVGFWLLINLFAYVRYEL